MGPVLIALSCLAGVALVVLLCVLLRLSHRHRTRRAERARRDKGKEGEVYIASLLKQCMLRDDTLLNNVILSHPHTKASFEIDHILLSRRGIFVIETKNRSGDIYGDDEADRWIQVLGRGDIRHEFYSPVKQCVAHAKKVASVTNCKKVYPLVVFAEGNTQYVKSAITLSPRELCSTIEGCGAVLSAREVETALARLKNCMSHSISAEEHIKNVQMKYGE